MCGRDPPCSSSLRGSQTLLHHSEQASINLYLQLRHTPPNSLPKHLRRRSHLHSFAPGIPPNLVQNRSPRQHHAVDQGGNRREGPDEEKSVESDRKGGGGVGKNYPGEETTTTTTTSTTIPGEGILRVSLASTDENHSVSPMISGFYPSIPSMSPEAYGEI